jgi:N-acetylmuramoyl-L-alanine amidase
LGNPYWKEYEKQHKQYASLPRYFLPNPAAIINEIHEEPVPRSDTPGSKETTIGPGKNDIPEPSSRPTSLVQPSEPVEAVEKSDRNPPSVPSNNPTPAAKEKPEPDPTAKEGSQDEKTQPVHSKMEEKGPDFKNILIMRKQAAEAHRTQIQEIKLGRKFVIVLDPGHGGKDPGAISRDGTLEEKSVTLDLALRAKKLLSVNPNIEVLMTREEDKFMSLDDRAAVANSTDADLFVSIHCNSHRDASSRGIETYYLDTAGSNREMKTAAQENGLSIKKMSDLQVTLLKLMVASKKKESAQLAASVQDALEASMSLSKKRGVRQAPFCVLMGCKMPAVLVECAFLSNKRESLKLKDPDHLDKIAEGMVSGAVNYMKGLSETKITGN